MDLTLAVNGRRISFWIKVEPEPFEPLADAPAYIGCVFANAAAEYDGGHPSGCCQKRAYVFPYPVGENVERKFNAFIFACMGYNDTRVSCDRPETPSRPDFLFNQSSTTLASTCSCCARKATNAGSTSPDRVPMTKPSSGVNPTEVSIDLPPTTAVADDPPSR